MKINSILIRGFRGFNEEREIHFNDKLTLIYAPNSYGKTSISEAFEWLLYGSTSKVERAKSKLEFRGSYRNVHYSKEEPPRVKLKAYQAGKPLMLTASLHETDEQHRYIGEDLKEAPKGKWPFEDKLDIAPKPFILQHALKDLLLASPGDRFTGFAQLLGFDELDQIQKDIIALCTAPSPPQEVVEIQRLETDLKSKLSRLNELGELHKAFVNRKQGLDKLYRIVRHESLSRVPEGTEDESILPQLLLSRQKKISKFIEVDISFHDISDEMRRQIDEDSEFFLSYLTDEFIDQYSSLMALAALSEIVDHEAFLKYGLERYEEKHGECPFCGKKLSEAEVDHMRKVHRDVKRKVGNASELKSIRGKLKKEIDQLDSRINNFFDQHVNRLNGLLASKTKMDKLSKVLKEDHPKHFENIQKAVKEASVLVGQFDEARANVKSAVDLVTKSLKDGKENSELMKTFASEIPDYIKVSESLRETISTHAIPVKEADQILQKELDKLAQTQDLSVLIELLESRKKLEKGIEIESLLEGLKDLRASFDKFVANRMLEAVAGQMSKDVLRWYEKIKTAGDPDIHFKGFDLERTQKGKIKARRVEVKAQSYGEELVSAVSSLSESKLNALGLCLSLSMNLSEESPFEFILIDDPIQSLDLEHAAQFVQIIREVSEESIQLVVLSHNKPWLDQVRLGCGSLNGTYYEITGYTEKGPTIKWVPWVKSKQRLDTVDAILKNKEATTVHLQQAEEELRLTFSELTAAILQRKKEKEIHPSSLNSDKIHKKLIECGIENSLVDRVAQAYQTIDPAHHSDPDYVPNRDRIKTYHSWAHELSQQL